MKVTKCNLRCAGLPRDVDRVRDDGNFAEKRQLVVGKETVGFVEEKISSNEFLEAPIFTLVAYKLGQDLSLNRNKIYFPA